MKFYCWFLLYMYKQTFLALLPSGQLWGNPTRWRHIMTSYLTPGRMFGRTKIYLTLVIQLVNTCLTLQMKALTLENDLELKICSPYYPLISTYDISAYKSLNIPWKALSDANTSCKYFFTPQMESHALENDLEYKKCFPYYPHVSAYDIRAYNSLNIP